MRPRYRPGWQPSYIPGSFGSLYAEDAQRTPVRLYANSVWYQSFTYDSQHPYIMDALRMSDSLIVALKLIKTSTGEDEITMLFSDDDPNSDPHNHCVRILEVLPVPGADAEKILVMVWMRNVMDPRFRTIGEAIQFFKEMIEVCVSLVHPDTFCLTMVLQSLQYVHRNNVAHRCVTWVSYWNTSHLILYFRDCSLNNMAMEANSMFIRQYHPMAPKKRYDWHGRALHFSRTRRPPRYYLIDFGCSRMYDPSQPRPLEYSLKSGGYIPRGSCRHAMRSFCHRCLLLRQSHANFIPRCTCL